MLYSIDIETENKGIDVVNGVTRILSVQIGDEKKQEVYYADATLDGFNLKQAKTRIEELLDAGHSFAGYNIKNFDLPKLAQFLGVNIPESRAVDIIEMNEFAGLKKKIGWNRIPLERACQAYGIDAGHKELMTKRASPYFLKEQVIAEARTYVKSLIHEKGWSEDYCLSYAVKSLAYKQAIIDAYQEFIKEQAGISTLFYKYAIGDIICEHKLRQALTGSNVG